MVKFKRPKLGIPSIMRVFGSAAKKKHRRVNLSEEQKAMIPSAAPKKQNKKLHAPGELPIKKIKAKYLSLKTEEDIDKFIQGYKEKKRPIEKMTDLQIRLALQAKALQIYYCEQRDAYHKELDQEKQEKKKLKAELERERRKAEKRNRSPKGVGGSVWLIYTPMGNKR